MIPYGKQYLDESDIQAVVDVLKSDWLTQGPKVREFEEAVAHYCGAQYAVACSSGTAALHLAYMVAALNKNDTVVTSPITFLATANAAKMVGAEVSFCDIDPQTRNINPDLLSKILNKQTIKAVLPVHFSGLPCDMLKIYELAQERRALVIEDACHALGARYQDPEKNWHRVGSCKHSDMAVFSFHPVKAITTGEGGLITTNNKEFYKKLCLYRNHGMEKDQFYLKNKNLAYTNDQLNPWYYEMHQLGFNYRITDIQCALGLNQLKRLGSFIARRRQIAAHYSETFKKTPQITLPLEPSGYESAYHLYSVEINFKELGVSRNDFMKKLNEKGIKTQVHYIPIHLQPFYGGLFRKNEFPNAEQYYEKTLSLPIYPSMTDQQIEHVIHALSNILG